jgi:thiamine pyrophosphate-dependent acetolactate synthase large subunit-like protein
MMEEADCVVVFGAGLNFLTMSFGASIPPVPLIQVDAVRDHIGRWTTVDLAVEIRQLRQHLRCVERLVAAGPRRQRREQLLRDHPGIADDPAQDFQPANTARTVDRRLLGIELDKLLPGDRNLVCDAGNFLGVAPYLSVPDPGHFKMTSDFASIGLGFGAALGLARGRPDKPTVLIIGDGGFLMTLGELETAAREDLPLIVIVMNDCAYAQGAEPGVEADVMPIFRSVGARMPEVSLSSMTRIAPLRA